MNNGDRVYHTETGETGRFLRIEHYPKRGKLATVKWDWAMSARPVDPALIRPLHN